MERILTHAEVVTISLLASTARPLIQDYCESPKSHTFAVLEVTCIRGKEVVCPEGSAIRCIRGANFIRDPL